MEIIGVIFTKLLQARTYNALHTSAARQKLFSDERLSSFAARANMKGVDGPTLQRDYNELIQTFALLLHFVGPTEVVRNY